ncbi:PAS/PAC sensor signal transduction histidine kinase [Halothece sp. PCC 7418]|uniref:ATP-binding protein n=1 Tax=Halothece sp. (strain PCC 7418) TaxID=65093 RepID=UPI0002A08B53|nr:ATP-binding protein [Halothece sp. PCC 7418]AFZ44355.1 PAS/PAC sensor signal transduction histidine kinase [Halothece sp. PCC 7418]
MSSFLQSAKNISSRENQLQQRITELEEENQQLKQQLATEATANDQPFRKIFNASNDAILVIDPSADQILEANPQAEKLLGYSRDELLNSVSVSKIHPEEMPQLMAFTRNIIAVGQGWTNELSCLTKSGEKRPSEISATVVYFQNRPCIIALVRDISERLKAQKEAIEATEALAELGELTSMIVHEIRNPLTTVLMGLEALQKIELPPRDKARLELASEEAQRLQSLLEEIRLYTKPQLVEKETIDLNQLAQDVLEIIYNQFSVQHDIQLITMSEPVKVLGDQSKLKQVFINLITNAGEAVETDEPITWKIEREKEKVKVQVHNYGSPIPPEILPKLTKPFFTTKSSGMGLGLPIAKRIVESHQGNFSIESHQMEGTTITLSFPVASAEEN